MPYRDENKKEDPFKKLHITLNNMHETWRETRNNISQANDNYYKINRERLDKINELSAKIKWNSKLHLSVFYFIILSIFIISMICLINHISSSSIPSHCTVEPNYKTVTTTSPSEITIDGTVTVKTEEPNGFILIGVREWKSDLNLGTYPTLEKTIHAANLLKCNISHRK